MSDLLRRLKGVWCIDCLMRGHRCQAQMFEGMLSRCLRCADGEDCIFETVRGASIGRCFACEVDPCIVPELSAEDLKRFAKVRTKPVSKPLKGAVVDRAGSLRDLVTRANVILDLNRLTVSEVARKHRIPWSRIFQFKKRLEKPCVSRSEAIRAGLRRKIIQHSEAARSQVLY